MDPRRRRLLVSLAIAPALPASSLLRAAEAPATGGAAAIPLRASAGGAPPLPPLRYGDASPGPILRMKRDAPTRISFANGLPGPTSLDLHGLRAAAPLGGIGPVGGTILPGTTVDIAFTPHDSGTFWFHPWALDPRTDDTARGLAGLLLVDEPVPPEVDADLVAILTDRWPLPDDPSGRPAAALRIGGENWPRVEVLRPGARVRLRLVNGSTRQALALTCAGATPSVVAIDGQPSALFAPRGGTVPVAPGARVDLMFDMPGTPGSAVTVAVRGAGPAAASDVALVLRAEGEPRPGRGPIAALAPNPLLPTRIALEAATRATLVLTSEPDPPPGAIAAWSVNGIAGFDLPRRPLFRVKRGTPVTLAVRNASSRLVGVRVHGFCLRLLHDLDDGWELNWRESLLVPPGVTHHAAFVADLPGRWLIESPFFDQAAGGLRTWFEVT